MRNTHDIYDSQRFDISKQMCRTDKSTQTTEDIIEEIKEDIEEIRKKIGEAPLEITETIEELIGCVHILTRGKFTGNICGKRIAIDNKCKRHV